MVYVSTEDFIWALGAKSRYFPPSSLDINNLWSCRDNPEYYVILKEVTVMHWPNKTHEYSTPCKPGRSYFTYLKTHFIIWATASCSFTEKHAMKYLQWLQNNSHMSLDSFCHFLIQCPIRYQNRHFFNNSKTNEDIAMKHTHTHTHYRHIPLHFSQHERTPVQISLQYLHWC
jgi:hypothetical protein